MKGEETAEMLTFATVLPREDPESFQVLVP
jgi:hypothetical protein